MNTISPDYQIIVIGTGFSGLGMGIALKKAGVPAEYHIYAEGGHAFGLNKTALDNPDWDKLPIADWENLVIRYLQTIKMIAR